MFNFGFKKVNEEEKQKLVSSVFSSVSSKYDVMNNVMSFGVQKLWKKNFIDLISLKQGGVFLDLACGSGDITELVLKKAEAENKEIFIVMCDENENMLNLAKKRFENFTNIEFVHSGAEDLPFEENKFDGVFISFGIRNFTNIEKSLKALKFCLKEGGSLFILEFFSDVSKILGFNKIYKTYVLKGIPLLGKIIVKDENSYRYFGESILNFYSKGDFKNLLQKAGFKFFAKVDSLFEIVGFFHFKK